MAKAYFSAGCFWGVEYYFKRLKGVTKTVVGFMGGEIDYPSYKQVKTGLTGHLETIEVEYDPEMVSYEALVRYFFEIHDFEQADGQGVDIGTQYLSAIWFPILFPPWWIPNPPVNNPYPYAFCSLQ